MLAALTLAVLGNVLRLTNVSAEIQSIAVGLLLIVSVVIPNLCSPGQDRPSTGLGEDDVRRPDRSGPVRHPCRGVNP